jgi:hypothetical protein
MRKVLIICFGYFILIFISGCGVYSFTGASVSPDIKSVSIAYFPNRASIIQPALSQVFTEKMKDKFVSQTNLTLEKNLGDLQFTGFITEYNNAPTAIKGDEEAALNRLTITVSVKFVNTKDEKQSFETMFSRFSEYDSRKNLADVEKTLIEDICNQLVDDIFNKAVINW